MLNTQKIALSLILATACAYAGAMENSVVWQQNSITFGQAADSLDQYKKALKQLIYSNDAITPAYYSQFITECITLAQTRKLLLEQELVTMGTSTINKQKIAEGSVDIVFAAWSASGLAAHFLLDLPRDSYWRFAVLPTSRTIRAIENKIGTNVHVVSSFLMYCHLLGCAIYAPYQSYIGITKISAGLNHKQTVEKQIKVLDEIIAYLESIQDPANCPAH